MTNEELIVTIREEIERLIEESDFDESANLYSLLSFLSTLEEQAKYKVHNPIFDECVANVDPEVREEVERNIDRMLEDDSLIDEIKNFIEEYGYERGEDKLLIAIVARHFYELGCRRTAEKYDEIEYNRQREEGCVPNDLEEAAKKFVGYDMDCDGLRDYEIGISSFIAGAKWQKEQMMKEAVWYIAQADITATGNIVIPFIRIGYTALSRYGIKVGDKVRIIIVKEDEK